MVWAALITLLLSTFFGSSVGSSRQRRLNSSVFCTDELTGTGSYSSTYTLTLSSEQSRLLAKML